MFEGHKINYKLLFWESLFSRNSAYPKNAQMNIYIRNCMSKT